MRRLFTFLLLSLLAASTFAATVDSGTCGAAGSNLRWKLSDAGVLTISGTGAMEDYDLWPNQAPWIYYTYPIKSVIISDGVTSIGSSAFDGCTALESVVIPEGVTSIGSSAFDGCTALTSVVIPEGVTSIGSAAFSGCAALESVVIPEGVTSIGDRAFDGCTALTSVVIPEGVTSIGSSAFSGCAALESVVIPEGVTSIGDRAFSGCDALTSVVIPEGVTSIGYGAFSACTALEKIEVSAANTAYISIDGVLFNKARTELIQYPAGKKATTYTIPSSVTSIGSSAFGGCDALTSVVIPEGVTSIGGSAFGGCAALTSVVIPEGVTSIEDGAFYNCSSLTSIEIPESVTSIGDGAFAYCDALTSVVIPEGVTSIGSWAFGGCAALERVEIPSSVTSIEGDAFNDSMVLEKIEVSAANTAYISIDGVLYNKDQTELIKYPAGKKATTYTIPSSVMSIGDWAFLYCAALESVVIPEGVTSIGDDVFHGCTAIESITSLNPEPPACDRAFGDVNQNIPVYVPAESIELYRNAERWNYFTNFLPIPDDEEDDEQGTFVEETSDVEASVYARDGMIYCDGVAEFEIYNLVGQEVSNKNGSLKGMYIVAAGEEVLKLMVD